MIEFNGRKFCENCFSEWTEGNFCTHCGYNPDVTATDPTMLKPGSVLLGKYIVGKVIGKGGFGVTYVAYDITTNKKVAIKEFFPYGVALRAPGTTTVSVSSMDNADAFKMGAEKFYNEAKLVSKFNGNPNIVGVHEFFYENDTVYFAMEYLQGHTLKEHIQEHGVLTPAQALFIFQNVSNALMAAHSLNVMHRDISPDNIILCDNGDVKLIDFGAARQVVAEHSQSFSVILKPGFAPLEQYQKKGNQGPWTDIYSLGATIYHSLTEDIPEDPMSRIDDDEEFSSNKYNIEPELWAVIQKATQLKIEDRYGDVFMLRNDLNSVSYKPEPVIVPTEAQEEKMPEIHTAVPFGMSQAVNQPAQPVAVAAGNSVSSAQPIGNPVQQGAADSQPKEKFNLKESYKKHRNAIAAAVGVLVLVVGAAVIIPRAINKPRVQTTPSYSSTSSYPSSSSASQSSQPTESSQPTQSSQSTQSSAASSSTSAAPKPPVIPTVNLSDKIFYNQCQGRWKKLYESLYDAISRKAETFDLSSYNCKCDDVGVLIDYIMNEISEFDYMNTYSLTYKDANDNDKCDGNEIITKLTFRYNNDHGKIDSVINQFSNQHAGDTVYEKLYAFHDKLIREVEIVDEDSTPTCHTAYGALVEKKAAAPGIAGAFCLYAQELGLPCVVTTGYFDGKIRSWCRVKINGVWYNVDVYGDMIAGNYVKRLNVSPGNTDCYHTYFLCNDDYFMKGCGYELYSQYKFMLSGEYAANSKYDNFYIQGGINGKNFHFFYTVDSVYEIILDWAAERYKDGHYNSSVKIASFIHDDVLVKLGSNLVKDLKSKHGITVSGFSSSYNIDNSIFEITLKP